MAKSYPQPAATSKATTSKESTSVSNALDLDMFYDVESKAKNADTFKSLDFSDVAIYGNTHDKGVRTNDADFRHFHQMRIFIETGETQHHTSNYNGRTVITCNLPERISYALNSKWEAPLNFNDATFNLLMQMGGQYLASTEFGNKYIGDVPSGTMRTTTLRLWQNTDPLSLDLEIPVIDDGMDLTGVNLVEALEILGSLVLPKQGNTGFYVPPPSPLNLSIDYTSILNGKDPRGTDREFNLHTRNYSRIILQLGGILLVDNCIIERVDVQYPNTKAQIMHDYNRMNENFGITGGRYLHPLLAVVRLKISTLEALTANTYSRMLWARPQSDQGHLDADFRPITNTINAVRDLIEKKVDQQNPTTTTKE